MSILSLLSRDPLRMLFGDLFVVLYQKLLEVPGVSREITFFVFYQIDPVVQRRTVP